MFNWVAEEELGLLVLGYLHWVIAGSSKWVETGFPMNGSKGLLKNWSWLTGKRVERVNVSNL
ncbi:hypothetical protein HanRHA438_Chr13g0628361 [Helianthus annuus]|nr:hypothetical protein HanRHA438_Chr13g0628361 [Helianthus annuus]